MRPGASLLRRNYSKRSNTSTAGNPKGTIALREKLQGTNVPKTISTLRDLRGGRAAKPFVESLRVLAQRGLAAPLGVLGPKGIPREGRGSNPRPFFPHSLPE
jgi:hypothetical protein